MKVSDLAKSQMRDIGSYYKINFGLKVMQNVIASVKNTFETLRLQPFMGSIEPLLDEYPQSFRSLVQHHNLKIVYWLEDETVKIALIFDTRQRPEKLPYIVKNKSSWVCEEPVEYRKPSELL